MPVALGVEATAALRQIGQIDPLQNLQQGLVAQAFVRVGIEQLLAQSTEHHVRLLWQEQNLLRQRPMNRAAAGKPQPGHRPQQGAFTAAALANDEQALTRRHAQRQIVNQGALAVRRLQRHVVKLEMRCAQRFNATLARHFGGGAIGQTTSQHVETVDAGGKTAQPFEVFDNQRNRTEHRGKSPGRLHRPADLEFAGKHLLGNQGTGNHQGQ